MDATLPGWVGPTIAISLVVIALSVVTIGAVTLRTALSARRRLAELAALVDSHRRDFQRIVDSARRLAESATDEARHYLRTGRTIRKDVEDGMRRLKGRLSELEALYDVVHEEVEETALDVAARVRAVRQGTSVVGRLRRWMVRGRR